MACLFCSADGISVQEIHYPSNLRLSLQRYQWQPPCTPPCFLLRMKNLAITLEIHTHNIHSAGEWLNTATKFFETGRLSHLF